MCKIWYYWKANNFKDNNISNNLSTQLSLKYNYAILQFCEMKNLLFI